MKSRVDNVRPEGTANSRSKVSVLGIGLTPFNGYGDVADVAAKSIKCRSQKVIAAINPEKLYRAQFDQELRVLLNDVDIAICDGIGAALACRVLNGKRVSRITGVGLFYHLIAAAVPRGWRIFLLGAAPDVNDLARNVLMESNPELDIVGNIHGYFEDSRAVIDEINSSKADIVFVGMGSPRQELWIQEYRDKIGASILMGVGGTFDVVSGRVRRAPRVFRRTGTEWLFRLISEPKRIKRQLVLPKFVILVAKRRLGLN